MSKSIQSQLLKKVEPWEKGAWSPEQERMMYLGWATYFTHRQQREIAANYYNKTLDIPPADPKALYYRSMCKRSIAQTKGALRDAQKAADLDPYNAPINVEICNILYELNQFENCKIACHDNMRLFIGNKVSEFQKRLYVVDKNFQDSIGETLGPFILRNKKTFEKAYSLMKELEMVDERPLWKILREQGKCDVLSILEEEEILLSPREVARRKRAFRVFNQIYFNKSWIDVLFIKSLENNPTLLLPQAKESTPILRDLVKSKYGEIFNFLKMLHARSPLYNEYARKCPDRKVWEYHREAHLNRVQYQTHRNMRTILRSVRQLRQEGKVETLATYVEGVMGDYVVVKTFRVMPWKFEFLSEIYYTLALAHADRYLKVRDQNELGSKLDNTDRLRYVLYLKQKKNKDLGAQFVFGDKSTYQDTESMDNDITAYKMFLLRLEKRLKFAKYTLERCYLLHEIARTHLRNKRYDECCSSARRAIAECRQTKNQLWQFLTIMLIVKSHAALQKIERCKEALDAAYILAKRLNSYRLCQFVDTCRKINQNQLAYKKSQSMDSIRRHTSKLSLCSQSSNSLHDSNESEDAANATVETTENYTTNA